LVIFSGNWKGDAGGGVLPLSLQKKEIKREKWLATSHISTVLILLNGVAGRLR
jgi:hypothetical protein